jgi:hypothetical protein
MTHNGSLIGCLSSISLYLIHLMVVNITIGTVAGWASLVTSVVTLFFTIHRELKKDK